MNLGRGAMCLAEKLCYVGFRLYTQAKHPLMHHLIFTTFPQQNFYNKCVIKNRLWWGTQSIYTYAYVQCVVTVWKYTFVWSIFLTNRTASTSACLVALLLVSHWSSMAAAWSSTLSLLRWMTSKSLFVSSNSRPTLLQREMRLCSSKYRNTPCICLAPEEENIYTCSYIYIYIYR